MKKITREDIVQAYYDLHAEYDHNKITFKLLSEKSGYSRRTIYNYFQTKEDLHKYVYAFEQETMADVDFINKTARENALVFCDGVEEVREIIKKFSSQEKLVNEYQAMCARVMMKQETIKNELLASSIAAAVNRAVTEYANDLTYNIDDLIDVVAQVISPYIKK